MTTYNDKSSSYTAKSSSDVNVWDKWIIWNTKNTTDFKKHIDGVGNGELKLAAELGLDDEVLGGTNDPVDITDVSRPENGGTGFGYISVKEFGKNCKDVRLGAKTNIQYEEFKMYFVSRLTFFIEQVKQMGAVDDYDNKLISDMAHILHDSYPIPVLKIPKSKKKVKGGVKTTDASKAKPAKPAKPAKAAKKAAKPRPHVTKAVYNINSKQVLLTTTENNKVKLKKYDPFKLIVLINSGEINDCRIVRYKELIKVFKNFAERYTKILDDYALEKGLQGGIKNYATFIMNVGGLPPYINGIDSFRILCEQLIDENTGKMTEHILDNMAQKEAIGGYKLHRAISEQSGGNISVRNDEPVLAIVNEHCGYYFVGIKTYKDVICQRISQHGLKLGFKKSSKVLKDCNDFPSTPCSSSSFPECNND